MRLRTVKRRLRLTGLPAFYVYKVYEELKGFSDESTELNAEHHDRWVEEVSKVLEKYRVVIRKEIDEATRDAG